MSLVDRAKVTWGLDRAHPYEELPPIPKTLLIEISNGCNHACLFCANPQMTRKIGRIDRALMERVMTEAAAEGCEEIGFYTTGEPLIHTELETFVAWASRLGYGYIYISTNGALATPERLRRLIDAGLNSLKFSINAGSRESYRKIHGKDDWDKVMGNLKAISQYRKTMDRELRLFVTFVVTTLTEHEVEPFREMVAPLVDEVSFEECTSQMGTMTAAQRILAPEAPSGLGDGGICPLPFMRLHVTYEGYLTLCCSDYQNYLAVADLNSESLVAAWQSAPFQAARRRHLADDIRGILCGNCWYGDMAAINPLRPELACLMDFPTLYESQSSEIAEISDDHS